MGRGGAWGHGCGDMWGVWCVAALGDMLSVLGRMKFGDRWGVRLWGHVGRVGV